MKKVMKLPQVDLDLDKVSDNKSITLRKLTQLSVEERVKFIEPIIQANSEQFSKLANTIAEVANFGKTFSDFATSIKIPIVDIFENFKVPELPQIPDFYSGIDPKAISFERYDPPVTIKKSKSELELEAKQAYLTDLHIQLLETQLAIAKRAQTPQYDINIGIIKFMGKEIEIPLNTNLEMVARVVLKNVENMKRKWSWDEIVEENRDSIDLFDDRKIYIAARAINDKVAQATAIKDFLICKPTSTVQLNPVFLPK